MYLSCLCQKSSWLVEYKVYLLLAQVVKWLLACHPVAILQSFTTLAALNTPMDVILAPIPTRLLKCASATSWMLW